jgi:hypothetical protein
MRKLFFTLALIVSIAGGASRAQVDGKSIGLRLGYPTEASFQMGLSKSNRLELGLGLRSHSYGSDNSNYSQFSVSGVYQWVWDLSALSNGFNWYAGVGGAIGYYSYSYLNTTYSALPLSVLGQIGIEYNFNIPIRLSLDYRPAFQLNGNGNGFIGDEIALGIRYRF